MTASPGSGDADVDFLVPVSGSPTLDAAVEYAAREARDVAAETDARVTLYLVAPAAGGRAPNEPGPDDAGELLSRAADIAERELDVTDPQGTVDVETASLLEGRYPFDPLEYVDAVAAFAAERDVETLVYDPGHRLPAETPIVRSLEDEFRDAGSYVLEVAPVERSAREQQLVTRGGLAQFLTLFGLSFAFYVLLGGFAEPVFDLVTGGASAFLVAGVLSRITFERSPDLRRTASSALRWALYVPYLLWKVAVANVQIAYVVLHPSLPIDPSMERFEAGVWGGVPTATLANSITLTPGTLTVDVRNREFVVHSLTGGAREDLLDGTLERAVRFVFYGRTAMRYPSPRDRIEADERLEAGEGPHEVGDEPTETSDGTGDSS